MRKLLVILTLMLMALTVNAQSCPDDNHPHMIDLGLPSGTKWACCNVDASKPEEDGGYYAWGETEEKNEYYLENYKHCDGTWDSFHDLGKSISSTQYDVAYVKWGGVWVMPSLEQIEELCNECKSEWITVNGVKGRRFIGPNGGNIFLPAAGTHLGDEFCLDGFSGYYWSSSQHPSDSYCAYGLNFNPGSVGWNEGGYHISGHNVRPVAK